MSIDPTIVQRLSQSIALAFEQALMPLREEIATLRDEIRMLRGGTQTGTNPAARILPAMPATRLGRTAGKGMVCLVPGCPAGVLAKELCETHYRIMRRAIAAGESFDPKSQRPAGTRSASRGCAASGCNEGHYAKGLCRRHYMAARARARAHGEDEAFESHEESPDIEAEDDSFESPPQATHPSSSGSSLPLSLTFAVGGTASHGIVAMPTASMVMRVVQQHRGNLWKVAEVLGRNRATVTELIMELGLHEQVIKVRDENAKRITAAPLKERLADLLYREKLLEDLKCLKEVDEATRQEIQLRAAQLAKNSETQEDVLDKLGQELGLDAAGIKRLAWRYQLRRQLRTLRSKQAPRARARV